MHHVTSAGSCLSCSMFALSSGRAGNFEELGLAADEQEVAAIAASGRTPLEVVLPDGRCGEHRGVSPM